MLHETLSIGTLHAYINVFRTVNTMRASQLFEDFATINFKAAKLVNFAVESTGQVLTPVECSSPERLTTTRLEQLARQLHDDRIYLATTPESPFMRLGFHIAATYDSVGETGGWNALSHQSKHAPGGPSGREVQLGVVIAGGLSKFEAVREISRRVSIRGKPPSDP